MHASMNKQMQTQTQEQQQPQQHRRKLNKWEVFKKKKKYTYIFLKLGNFLNVPAASRTAISLSFNLLQRER